MEPVGLQNYPESLCVFYCTREDTRLTMLSTVLLSSCWAASDRFSLVDVADTPVSNSSSSCSSLEQDHRVYVMVWESNESDPALHSPSWYTHGDLTERSTLKHVKNMREMCDLVRDNGDSGVGWKCICVIPARNQ